MRVMMLHHGKSHDNFFTLSPSISSTKYTKPPISAPVNPGGAYLNVDGNSVGR